MPNYGYDYGQPFGDPNKFTRSTGEDEINRFNQWMRSQPWWQQLAQQGHLTDQQRKQVAMAAQQQGIRVPKDFHIDEGGNFNQKSRTKRNLAIAGIAGGAALGGLGLAGIGPLGGLGGGAGAAASGGSGAGAGAGSLAAVEGLPFGLPAGAASMLPGAAAAPAMADLAGLGAGVANAGSAVKGASSFLGNASDWLGPAIGAGTALVGSKIGSNNDPTRGMPPGLEQLLAEAVRRSQYQNPLFNATTDAALAGLPNYAKGKTNG